MSIYLKYAWTMLAFLAISCAQETSPTGGIKDEIPPQAVSMIPAPMSLQFSTSSFEMVFDEYIQIDDFNSQVLISPPLQDPAEYRLRGKRLVVFWTDPLLEHTTYQFNFGDAVKDYNEGNVNSELIYVFSTGAYIDSLSVSGKVFDSFTNEPVDKAKVMLYRQWNDSLPYTTTPDYVALTNAEGLFTARYLTPDTFMLVVIEEASTNYKYDGPPERIGFLDHLVLSAFEDTAYTHIVPLFLEADTGQYLKSGAGKDFGYYEVVYNVPVKDPTILFTVGSGEQALETISLLSTNGDTLRSWVKITERPEIEEIEVITTDGLRFADTTSWYIETDAKYREKAKLTVSTSASAGNIDPNAPVRFTFNHPLEVADTALIMLFEDSLQVMPNFVKLGNFNLSLLVGYGYSKTRSYNLIARAGAFKDIYGNYSDSLSFNFGLHPDDYYGSLKVNVIMKDTVGEGRFFIVLENANKKPVSTHNITVSQMIEFGKLHPGKYTLTGIFDKNQNEKWDSGSYIQAEQPERRALFDGELNVRSNWDLDVDWIVSTPFDP